MKLAKNPEDLIVVAEGIMMVVVVVMGWHLVEVVEVVVGCFFVVLGLFGIGIGRVPSCGVEALVPPI